MPVFAVSLASLCAAVLLGPALGQAGGYDMKFRHAGDRVTVWPGWNMAFGHHVLGLGDVDGDGHPDYAVCDRAANAVFNYEDAGEVYLYSGADGSLLVSHRGAETSFLGWSMDALGDIDSDGHADYLIGAPLVDNGTWLWDGMVTVHSGADYGVVRMHFGTAGEALGIAVAGLGDVDGDGVPDYALGAPGASLGPGAVHLHSGATGALLRTIQGAGQEKLGETLFGPGDLDGDGVPDLLAGARSGALPGSRLIAFSGADGAEIFRLDGVGNSASGAGDLDGDLSEDFLVADGSVVRSYSGATHALLRTYSDPMGLGLGDADGIGDVDGDQVPDLVACGSEAVLLSGADGQLIERFPRYQGAGISACAGVGDTDLDGWPDFVLGASGFVATPYSTGGAALIARSPLGSLSQLTLSVSGSDVVELLVRFPWGDAGNRYQLLASTSPGGPTSVAGFPWVPLGFDPVLQQTIGGRYPSGIVLRPAGFLNDEGDAKVLLGSGTAWAPLVNRTLHFAILGRDSQGRGVRCSESMALMLTP